MNQIELKQPDQSALDMATWWLINNPAFSFLSEILSEIDSKSEILFKLNPAFIDLKSKYYVTFGDDIYEFEDPHDAWEWMKEIDGACQLIYPGGILVAYK